jgi:hypothetical protein
VVKLTMFLSVCRSGIFDGYAVSEVQHGNMQLREALTLRRPAWSIRLNDGFGRFEVNQSPQSVTHLGAPQRWPLYFTSV